MTDEFSPERFRCLASRKLSFLQEKGFLRNKSLEESSSLVHSLVYSGTNVALVVSLDLRDQCVDCSVVKVKNGVLTWDWEGGYSSDLYAHLVRYEGYRGSPSGTERVETDAKDDQLEKMLDGIVGLLTTAATPLFADKPETLPL